MGEKLPMREAGAALKAAGVPPRFQGCCATGGGMSSAEQTALLPALSSQGVGFYCPASHTHTKKQFEGGQKMFVLIALLLYVSSFHLCNNSVILLGRGKLIVGRPLLLAHISAKLNKLCPGGNFMSMYTLGYCW